MSRALNIAIVGCGYWGVNYLRVFSEMAEAKVSLVCDTSEDRLRTIRERFPLIPTTKQVLEVLSSRWVDAVVVATPAASHFDLTSQFLAAGKHVLVEKPVTTKIPDALNLIRLADKAQLVLMVGHTFMYNSGILKLKELMRGPDFGQVYYLHATRTNMGPVRDDVNALWDLGTHDVAIFNFLLDAAPVSVSAVASKVLGKAHADVGFVTLLYPNNVLANIHASWIDPNKVREVVAVGSRRRIVFDDLNNLERVRIYEKGLSATMEADTFGEFRLIVRDGDIISPRVPPSEPLKNLAAHFLQCVAENKKPLSDGRNGMDVVRVMAAIDRSLAQNGAPVDVPPGIGMTADPDRILDPNVILDYRTSRHIPFAPLKLGPHARIRSGSVIYANSTIGHHLETGHNVIIREENRIGDHFSVWNNSVIDYGCLIGNNVRVHSNCYIAQFTTIEDEVFLAPGVSIANDPHPICALCMRGPTLKHACRIGVNATILPHVIIGQGALIGAGSVVTRDVPDFSVMAGNPARRLKDVNELECPFELTIPYIDGKDVKLRQRDNPEAEQQLRDKLRRHAEAEGRHPTPPPHP